MRDYPHTGAQGVIPLATRAEARQAMFEYIDGYYNTKRVQKRLGYLSPANWLKE
jgi:transposase InsO family protein